MSNLIKIALAGEGGQGVQAVAEIITEAAHEDGREALYIPNFGVEQRGGVSIAFVQISSDQIRAPKFQKGDIVIALSERAIIRTKQYVDQNTIFVYDKSITNVEYLPQNAKYVLGIPAVEISKTELHPRVFNVVILGAVVKATGVISEQDAKNALEKKLGHKFEQDSNLRELNYKALQRGMELVEKVI
ncbi:2-oxoacid:acceptor oxidoreductase family protein [Desulfoscipio geothermicus]|uniref:2-oxoglutarate ferredoxin oxidoreductase subunit gamma n=1 Tax=Desulfoscipio geothermicus DSM 3669 TaxID=1121426 RepID=A0A1I6CQ82_9FIRM|nr:2-oxoacid:acceptor oxidoreductase family protein [Desulfoscipio geothermicus]SFQ95324.1 2-oxoglutarate ferredoxin oxidoreductase subunit gamma [Desulfoscipio geothermicus DSM 3669]